MQRVRPAREIFGRLSVLPFAYRGATDAVTLCQLIESFCRRLDFGPCSRFGAGLRVHLAYVICSVLKDSTTLRITALASKSTQLLRGI